MFRDDRFVRALRFGCDAQRLHLRLDLRRAGEFTIGIVTHQLAGVLVQTPAAKRGSSGKVMLRRDGGGFRLGRPGRQRDAIVRAAGQRDAFEVLLVKCVEALVAGGRQAVEGCQPRVLARPFGLGFGSGLGLLVQAAAQLEGCLQAFAKAALQFGLAVGFGFGFQDPLDPGPAGGLGCIDGLGRRIESRHLVLFCRQEIDGRLFRWGSRRVVRGAACRGADHNAGPFAGSGWLRQ